MSSLLAALAASNPRKHPCTPSLEQAMGALNLERITDLPTSLTPQQPEEDVGTITVEGNSRTTIPFLPEEATPLPVEEGPQHRSKMSKSEPTQVVIPTMPLMRSSPPITRPPLPGVPLEDEKAYYHNFVHSQRTSPQITHHESRFFSFLQAEKIPSLGGRLNTGATTIKMLLQGKRKDPMEIEDSQTEHSAAADIQSSLVKYQIPYEELILNLPPHSDHSLLAMALKNTFQTNGGPLVIEIPYHHRSRWVILDAFIGTANPLSPQFMVRDSLYEVGYICPIENLFPKLKTSLPFHVFSIK